MAYRISYEINRRIEDYTSGGRYGVFRLTVRLGNVKDSAKEYNDHPSQWHLDRLKAIREDGSSTKYFESSLDRSFTLSWQSDPESSHWYAARASSVDLNEDACKVLAAVQKKAQALHGWGDVTPEDCVKALDSMRAVNVRCLDGVMSGYTIIEAPSDDDLISPWGHDEDEDAEAAPEEAAADPEEGGDQ